MVAYLCGVTPPFIFHYSFVIVHFAISSFSSDADRVLPVRKVLSRDRCWMKQMKIWEMGNDRLNSLKL